MRPSIVIGLAVATMVFAMPVAAQVTGGRGTPGVQMSPGERLDMQINMMATALTLNETQKRQFRQILDEARAASMPIQDAINQGRSALIDAIKAGSSQPEIDKVTMRLGGVFA